MNRRSNAYAILLVLGLTLSVIVGWATTSSSQMSMNPEQVVAYRQRIMKLNGAAWVDVQAKAKAGNIEGIAVDAEMMAVNAEHIPALFPKGSMTDKSKAKPDVWEKWADFEQSAKKFQAESEKLRDAAKAKNEQLTQDIVKDFGRNACGQCHQPFRVPPPQQPKS